MHAIRDVIHGYVKFNDLEEKIIDTPEMQRLRRIKQLGFAYMVYPSATHTRFEHSLGTFFLTQKITDTLNLGSDTSQKLRLVALLHDIAHLPFSHDLENFFYEITRLNYETTTHKVLQNRISGILEENGYSVNEILELCNGKNKFGKIINGDIDVDKLDYLVRDSYHTGVAHGLIDVEQIIEHTKMYDDKLVFDRDGIISLEHLIVARYFMFTEVYLHPIKLIMSTMFGRILEEIVNVIDLNEVWKLDDFQFTETLRSSNNELVQRLITDIDNRVPYKIIFNIEGKYKLKELGIDKQKVNEIKSEVKEKTKLPIVIDYQSPVEKELDILVLDNSNVIHIMNISQLAKTICEMESQRSFLRVYCPEQNREEAKNLLQSIIK